MTFVIVGRRPDRRGTGRTDPRARLPQPDQGLPQHRSRHRPGDPGRRRQGTAGHLRRRALGARPAINWRRWASSCAWGCASSASTRSGSTPRAQAGDKGRFDCGTVIWAAGVQASPLAGLLAEATGCRDRPRRADRRPPRPQPARAPRGLRHRRHGDPRQPSRCLRGGDAGRPPRRQHHQTAPEGRRERAVQVPRPRERRRHRPLQGHRQREGTAPQRLPRIRRLDVRAPGLPQRFRLPLHRTVALGPRHGRARPARTRVQRRAHRRRPEPARRREGEGDAKALPRPRRPDGLGRSHGPHRNGGARKRRDGRAAADPPRPERPPRPEARPTTFAG